MAHIHTQPGQHDHTASAFIVRTDFNEPKLMLHVHKKLGLLLQFGGHIELDETPWQAVSHEIREESGYDMDQLQLLQPKVRLDRLNEGKAHPVPVSHNTHDFDLTGQHFHTDSAYAFVTNEAPRHRLGAGESGDIRLLSAEELRMIPREQIFEGVRDIGLFILERLLSEWERISPSTFD